MRKLTSLALAGVMTATAFAVTATGASAGGWRSHGYYPQPYQSYNYYYYGPGAAIATGAIIGLTIGALSAPLFYSPAYAYPPAPMTPTLYPTSRYARATAHFDWCTATYRSYNGETDTWIDFQGIERLCISP